MKDGEIVVQWVFVIERVKILGRKEMIRLVLKVGNVPFEMGDGEQRMSDHLEKISYEQEITTVFPEA